MRRAAAAEGHAIDGLGEALQNLGGDAFGGLFDARGFDVEAAFRIESGVFGTQSVAGRGDEADAAPFAVAHFEDFEHAVAGSSVALAGDGAHVLVFDFGAALFELADEHEDGFQEVEGLEAAHHEGDAEIAGEFLVFGVTHHGANVSGSDKALHAVVGEAEQETDSGGDEDVRDENGKIGEAFAGGLPDGHCIGGRGGFEAHGEEYHLTIGVLAGNGDGVHGGVGDAHVAAFGFHAEEIAGGAGNAEHVAVGDEGHAGHGGDGDSLVDDLERSDADRAAGSMDEFELRREKLIDAVAHEGVGLAAADFHENPGTGDGGGDFGNERAGELGVAILVDEFHARGSSTGMVAGIRGSGAVSAGESGGGIAERIGDLRILSPVSPAVSVPGFPYVINYGFASHRMLLAREVVSYISKQLVKSLTPGTIETSNPDLVAEKVAEVISDELAVEDRLNDEVRDLLSQYSEYMRREGVSYQEMFRRIKNTLISQRKVVKASGRDTGDAMKLSRDKVSDISHKIIEMLRKSRDLRLRNKDSNAVRLEIVRQMTEVLMTEEKVDRAARNKIRTQKREIPEGSEEWDILLRRYYSEELKKLGIDIAGR